MKLKYHGLKTTRASVESASLMDASKVQGATKSSNWEERTINETMGMDDITFSTKRLNQDASRDSYWKTDF